MIPLRGLFGTVLLILASVPTAVHAESSKSFRPSSRFRLEAEVGTWFTSNLYHVPKRRLALFETDTGPGERFHNMQGPADAVVEVDVSAAWRYRFARKQDMELALKAQYDRPALNGLAATAEVSGAAKIEVTKHDDVQIEVGYLPKHFKKNYRHPVTGVFERADYSELFSEVELRHKFSKSFTAGVAYEFANRVFADPFQNRDRVTHDGLAYGEYRLSKRMDLGLALGGGVAQSPQGIEEGVTVDRSFRTLKAQSWVDINLRHNWTAEVSTEVRQRSYTTAETADASRYQRHDLRYRLGAEATKEFSKRFSLRFGINWKDSNSNRDNPGLEADEAGYEELELGLGTSLKF